MKNSINDKDLINILWEQFSIVFRSQDVVAAVVALSYFNSLSFPECET